MKRYAFGFILIFQIFHFHCINTRRQIKGIKTNNYEWVTVVTVSKWYEEMFQNWWHWYKLLDLGMKTIVIAEDNYMYKKLSNNSEITLMYFDLEEVRILKQYFIIRGIYCKLYFDSRSTIAQDAI